MTIHLEYFQQLFKYAVVFDAMFVTEKMNVAFLFRQIQPLPNEFSLMKMKSSIHVQ